MSRSRRLYHAALGGCVAVLLLAPGSLNAQDQAPDSEPRAVPEDSDTRAKNRDPGAPEEGAPSEEPTSKPETAGDGAISAPPADEEASEGQRDPDCEPGRIAECDLAAQQDMAESTLSMKRAAWVGVILTVIGLLLVWRTLHHTRRAADAARYTIDVMRKAERPFFLVTDLSPERVKEAIVAVENKWTRSKQVVSIYATVRNCGTRPGILRSFHVTACHQPPPPKQPEIDGLGELAGNRTLAPDGQTNDLQGAFAWDVDFIRPLIEFQEHLCVHGYVRYSDVHGTNYRSGFSFQYVFTEDFGTEFFVPSSPASYWYDIEENAEQPKRKRWWQWRSW